jgi:hypothetical protein
MSQRTTLAVRTTPTTSWKTKETTVMGGNRAVAAIVFVGQPGL